VKVNDYSRGMLSGQRSKKSADPISFRDHFAAVPVDMMGAFQLIPAEAENEGGKGHGIEE